MFHSIIVLPLFNLLILIYALIPGHDFGLALIIFTILVRLALWPLIRSQLHNQKAMRDLQPEIAKVKSNAKGDRQKEAAMLMELYKERNISPFASIKPILLQFPVLIALFVALREVVEDGRVIEQTYDFIKNFGYMKEVVANPALFETQLLGFIDLHNPNTYLAVFAALAQFVQSRQLMPNSKAGSSLRKMLQSAKNGDKDEPVDQTQAVSNLAQYLLPLVTFYFATQFPAALALYWGTSSVIAIIQYQIVLGQDVEEMEEIADSPDAKQTKQPKSKRRKK